MDALAPLAGVRVDLVPGQVAAGGGRGEARRGAGSGSRCTRHIHCADIWALHSSAFVCVCSCVCVSVSAAGPLTLLLGCCSLPLPLLLTYTHSHTFALAPDDKMHVAGEVPCSALCVQTRVSVAGGVLLATR